MIKVLTAAQMRQVDRLTTERCGIPSIILMENAAHAVARVITEKLGGSVKGKSILILCGPGNNGGDGAALARILWNQGAKIEVWLHSRQSAMKGDALRNVESLKKLHETQVPFVDPAFAWSEAVPNRAFFDRMDPFLGPDVVVDAVFGTGLTRPLDQEFGMLLSLFATCSDKYGKRPILISVDIPSGLDADRAEPIGPAFPAGITVTFTRPKPALVLTPTAEQVGELVVANIGTPQSLVDETPSTLFLAARTDVSEWLNLTKFSDSSYKNKRGHALVIAGSEDYSGAAVLAGNAAIRSGVGLATLACPADAKAEIASRLLPEVILTTIESDEFDEHVKKADAIAVGCGLDANDADIEKLVREIVETRKTPVIVDAGALWFFNGPDGLARARGTRAFPALVLTPHEGEFLRLVGTDDKDVIKDRVAAVRDFATKNNVILVLKGERVLIGEPGGKVVVNPTGNSGLGKAGNGDTLTGILTGFVAQATKMNIDVFETVVAAVYVAGMAGDVAEKKWGKRVMTASDVRDCLAEVFESLES